MDTYFAVSAPGLEPFTQQELEALGLHPQPEKGGMTFKGDLESCYRANLHLRTASRVLARLGNFFRATTFEELEQRAARLPWERFLTPGESVTMHVTCHKSRLYHTDGVMRSISRGMEERLGKKSPVIHLQDEEADHPAQLLVIRILNDRCTVSVDSSGELLHKRGYRQAVGKAPLRETLAAGIVMASGWDRISPLLDPFCGSGAIPIEAAMLALGIPPGGQRRFAFMDFPNFNEAQWTSIRNENEARLKRIPVIQASDRDAGVIKMAHENAVRAGVEKAIEFDCRAMSAINPPRGPGWVVTNPPFGIRVSEGKDLRNLYAQFGNVLRRTCPGWIVTVLYQNIELAGQMRMVLEPASQFINGGIKVRLAKGLVSA